MPRRRGYLAPARQRMHRIFSGLISSWLVFITVGRLTGIHLGDQVNLTLDAYLDGTLFNSISKDSYQLLAHGREADMVTSI